MALFPRFRAVPSDYAEWSRLFERANRESNLAAGQTFTATLTGVDSTVTGTVTYSTAGRVVVASFPDMTGTSDSTAATLTGLPAALYPALDQTLPCRITDNGTTVWGYVKITTDGAITLGADASGAAFTASGTKGVQETVLTWQTV